MIIRKPNSVSGIFKIFVVFSIMLLSSCAPTEVKLSVLSPAEVNTKGIRKVAVGTFELAEVNTIYKLERNGKWKTKKTRLSNAEKDILSKQIRARVVSLLSTNPYFQLVYHDEFNALDADKAVQGTITSVGYKTAGIDAVINGKVWLDVVKTDGVEPGKEELEYKRGGRSRKRSYNYDVQVLAFWPYKSISGTLALEMKFTRLNPTEVISVTFDTRKYSRKVGGARVKRQDNVIADKMQKISSTAAKARRSERNKKEIEDSELVLPNFNQLVANLAESIAANFVRRISVSQNKASYIIAPDGNKTAKMLIEAGAYEKAIEVLNKTMNKSGQKNPDNVYNRGLCFEATGDYGLADLEYKEAVKANPQNLTYAQGVGRIDRLKRNNLRLKNQLSGKNQ